MAEEIERSAEERALSEPESMSRRAAFGRFAAYTAPLMLAALISQQHPACASFHDPRDPCN